MPILKNNNKKIKENSKEWRGKSSKKFIVVFIAFENYAYLLCM